MVVLRESNIQYEVKIINPSGKGGKEIKRFEAPQFSKIDQLEEALLEQCMTLFQVSSVFSLAT